MRGDEQGANQSWDLQSVCSHPALISSCLLRAESFPSPTSGTLTFPTGCTSTRASALEFWVPCVHGIIKSWNHGLVWVGFLRFWTPKSSHFMGRASCPTLGDKWELDPHRSHCPSLHEFPECFPPAVQSVPCRDSDSIATVIPWWQLEKIPPQNKFPVTRRPEASLCPSWASHGRETISDLPLQDLLSVWMLAGNGWLGAFLINSVFPKQ